MPAKVLRLMEQQANYSFLDCFIVVFPSIGVGCAG